MLDKLKKNKSFRKGLREVRICDNAEVRRRLWEIIGCRTKVTFYKYVRGEARLDVFKAQQIERLFAEFGVAEPWGD